MAHRLPRTPLSLSHWVHCGSCPVPPLYNGLDSGIPKVPSIPVPHLTTGPSSMQEKLGFRKTTICPPQESRLYLHILLRREEGNSYTSPLTHVHPHTCEHTHAHLKACTHMHMSAPRHTRTHSHTGPHIPALEAFVVHSKVIADSCENCSCCHRSILWKMLANLPQIV